MKLLRKIVFFVLGLYLVFWAGLAAYFSYAERHKGLLESNLSRVFERPVSIERFTTAWVGVSPRIQIQGFKVKGDVVNEPAFAFESLSAEVSPLSVLTFWPRFTEFAVEKPLVEIVSLSDNQMQIAGISLRSNRPRRADPERIISWLLNHQSAAWHDGEVVWRTLDGDTQRFRDISFVYQRAQQDRVVNATVQTPKGALAFTAETHGDLLSDSDWDASLEVLGNRGERLLASDDVSLKVENAVGQLGLKTLDVARIRDFIQLTGLANKATWLMDAELAGRLHDVDFSFSGPLLKMREWTLSASASDVGFKSIDTTPAMNNLSGVLTATKTGGTFEFSTAQSTFEWQRWFDKGFPINHAQGQFIWEFDPQGELTISLRDGEFEDQNIKISKLNASASVDRRARQISNFGDLFRLDSVADLSYEDGELVESRESARKRSTPIFLDADLEFELSDMAALDEYFPKDPRITKFHEWWSEAVNSGRGFNGKAAYKGEVSKTALFNDKASLIATAEFADVEMDYGYQREWPILENASGSATLIDDELTITPKNAEVMGSKIESSEVKILSLFKLDRSLQLQGSITVGLPQGMEFLFQGPLLPPEKRPKVLPIVGKRGSVAVSTEVTIPLANVNLAAVTGQATITNGVAELPEGVPLTDVNGVVDFTERRVTADNIRARFLGNDTRARLITVAEAQPPIMKLIASGKADVAKLSPWVGEHLLTWFSGEAPWQGAVLIDGPRVEITSVSELEGVTVTAPAPLAKGPQQARNLTFSMVVGDDEIKQELSLNYADVLHTKMRSNGGAEGSLFDNALIRVGPESDASIPPGVNFDIQHDEINVDDWLSAIIDIAAYEPSNPVENTAFLDAMRSVNISAASPFCLAREFGPLNVSAVSVDGYNWIGTLKGDNVDGTLIMQPRADVSNFELDLTYLNLGEEPNSDAPPEPIDYSLSPAAYPALKLNIDKFVLTGKSLGRLELQGEPIDGAWRITKLDLTHNGIHTTASGQWVNDADSGSISSFDFSTDIDEAEGVLDDMDFDGFIKKGEGSIKGNVKWIGAPHEFDYARLNGDFDMRIKDGELVKVEPGSGKLLGLLNFNAIARRLAFDFRDVFASGLKFDRMQYSGLFADGEAVMREAYIFTPAVFVRMEGKLDLDKELIDMEIHMSPELGGNLTLLSALANPTAGAVLFITQQLFKDEMRNSTFKSYRALGTWEDFEMVEFEPSKQSASSSAETTPTN